MSRPARSTQQPSPPWPTSPTDLAKPRAVRDRDYLLDRHGVVFKVIGDIHPDRAAFRYDSPDRLPKLTVPTLVCAAPADMLHDGSEEMAGRASGGAVSFCDLDPERGRDAAWAVREHGRWTAAGS